MDDLHALSATEMLRLYRSKALSPIDVTRAVLARIEAWEPHLHATYALDAEAALHQAVASEARWSGAKSADAPGALDGVPVTIKENIATRGVPLPIGSAATELVPAVRDAPPAARLREAGCVIVCKTTMPDYGMLSSGLSSFHALTRNPWDLHKNPGGSSAGAGAAAAAGYGPLHIGTDIGGSVRLPAGWCGVFALKPSAGRVPIHPPYAGRVVGPMTHSVEDAALMMSVLTLADARDPTSLPYQPLDWLALERNGASREGRHERRERRDAMPRERSESGGWPDLSGLRIGLLMNAGWGLAVDVEVAAAIHAAARAFEAAGAHLQALAPFMTRAMADGMDDFWRTRAWLDITALPEARRARVLPFIVDWARGGAGLSGQRVFEGFSQMAAIRDAAVAACEPFDIVLSPTAPIAAFAAGLACPTDDPMRPFEHIAFTLPYNMSEQPAASVNCGYTKDGMPIGLQLVGHRHDDLGVLRAARAWERMRPAQRAWPEPPGRASSLSRAVGPL